MPQPDEVRDPQDAPPKRARRPRRSRRQFIQVVAASAVAAIATRVPSFAAAAKPAPKPASKSAPPTAAKPKPAPAPPPSASEPAGPHQALPKEIEKLEKALEDQLKVIRAFPLPVGSPMAFNFRARRVKGG